MEHCAIWIVDCERSASALRELGDAYPEIAIVSPPGPEAGVRHVGHLALRLMLIGLVGRAAAGRPFVRGRYGKPMLPGGEADFSLSHAGAHVLMAVSLGGAVGIDLECVQPRLISARRRERLEALAQDMCGPLPEAPDARLIQAWTRLEALAKATGVGIGRLLEQLGARPVSPLVCDATASRPSVQSYLASAGLRVADLAISDLLCAAVALAVPCATPMARWLPAAREDIAAALGLPN